MSPSELHLSINGAQHRLPAPPPHRSLLHLLRDIGFTAAKEGCAEGECGACTVGVVVPAGERSRIEAVNSCLIPAAACHELEVWTVEGLGAPERLHPVQAAMVATGGSQCGFCSPGFVMSMACALAESGTVHAEDVAGNLCRCTGYRPIVEAAACLEPIEGPLEVRCAAPAPEPVAYELVTAAGRTSRPQALAQALQLLAQDPAAVVVAGGTDLMVEANLGGRRFDHVVLVDQLPELRAFEVSPSTVRLGAALSLDTIERELGDALPLLADLWPRFASRLIRRRASLGGNLATASPIGDSAPVLLALGAELELAGAAGYRRVPLDQFFRGYRRTALEPGELIVAVTIPRETNRIGWFEKFAKRREDDISTVAFAGTVAVREGKLVEPRLAFGGVAATPLRARGAEAAIDGLTISVARGRVEAALAAELQPLSDHRGSAEYRLAMAQAGVMALLDRCEDQP
jgi:xanthine dehydrogenase small subunit